MAAGCIALAVSAVASSVIAKVPGQIHCYGGVCHRVLSVDEVGRRVGRVFDTATSFYDIPERDRFNAGTLTSSGERFDAGSPQRVASSIYPDGTELLIWNPINGRAAHVRVNDFGPFYARRTLDVTRRIAEDLGFARLGVTMLKVVVVAAPLPEEARHRKGRHYTQTYGFIGRFSGGDLDDLAADLIASAAHERQTRLAMSSGAGQRSRSPARARLAWIHRVALARAEATPSATTALLLAIARDIASPAPVDAAIALPADRRLTAIPGKPRLLAAASIAPGAVAAGSAPPLVVEASSLATAAITVATTLPVAPAGAWPDLPPTTIASTATSGRAPFPDDAPAARVVSALNAMGLAAISGEWARWLIALALATPLLLVARRTRDRRPAEAPAHFAHPDTLTATHYADASAAADAPAYRAPRDRPVRLGAGGWSPGSPARGRSRSSRAEPTDERRPSSRYDTDRPDLIDLGRHARDLLSDGCAREAEPVFRALVAGCELAFGGDAAALVDPLRGLADALREQNRAAEALAIYDRAVRICGGGLPDGSDPRTLAELLEARALLRIAADDPASAVVDARRAVMLRTPIRPASGRDRGAPLASLIATRGAAGDDPDLGVALSILGEAERKTGDTAAAETAHRRALALFVVAEGSAGLRSAGSMTSLAEVLVARGRTAEARSLLLAALPILEARLGLRHPGVALSRAALANAHHAEGHIDAAVRLRRESLAILESVEGADHPDVAAARRNLASLIT